MSVAVAAPAKGLGGAKKLTEGLRNNSFLRVEQLHSNFRREQPPGFAVFEFCSISQIVGDDGGYLPFKTSMLIFQELPP
jgi:hypothetical protein